MVSHYLHRNEESRRELIIGGPEVHEDGIVESSTRIQLGRKRFIDTVKHVRQMIREQHKDLKQAINDFEICYNQQIVHPVISFYSEEVSFGDMGFITGSYSGF